MNSHTLSRVRPVVMMAVFAAAFAPGFARGQVRPPAIGTRAVIKPGAALKVGDRVVDAGKSPRIYVVDRADRDWLWLTSGGIGGWARASDVVPLDRAVLETATALVNRGNAATARGDFDRAIADYDEAMRLDPGDVVAQMNRGLARQSRGDLDGAIADYGGAIARGFTTAQAYNNRGQAWERKKEYAKAIIDYNEAIRLAPDYLLAWLNRGRARQAAGDLEKALDDYEGAIRLAPKSPWGHALQSSIFSSPAPEYRDGPRAVELASMACELGGPGSAYLCEVRAAAHEAAGEPDAAAEWRAKAREAASKTSAPESFAGRTRPRPEGSPTAGAPAGGGANIGYLSSIPRDYQGSDRGPSARGMVSRSQGSIDPGQPRSSTWLREAMERNHAEAMQLERSKLELDQSLLLMQQYQEQRFQQQLQGQRRQQP